MNKSIHILSLTLAVLLPLGASAQGYNSKGGSHKGYNTPYTQQERQASHWSGSGIALDSKVIATNHHVVDGATHLYVYFPESQTKYTAQAIATDEDNDLALVRITDPSFSGFPAIQYGFKQSVEDVGMGVFVLGYPRVDTMGEEVKLTTGVVSSRSGFQGNQTQYQVSAPVQPGNSGGPLFNDNGELIGIISAKHSDGAENVSYAVKLSYLNDLVASSGERIILIRPSRIARESLSQKCKVVIPCTVMVIADNERDSSPRGDSPSKSGSVFGSAGSYPIRVTEPTVTESNSKELEIVGVELSESVTAVYFVLYNAETSDMNFYVERNAYIEDCKTGERYTLITTEDCPVAPKSSRLRAGHYCTFILCFEPLPADCESFDFIEPDDESGWQFHGIQLR